jgi:hypothetical protein
MQLEKAPMPIGWHVVVFPDVIDNKVDIDQWTADACKWLKDWSVTGTFWAFLHGVNGKERERLSPIFYFSEKMDNWPAANEFADKFGGKVLK